MYKSLAKTLFVGKKLIFLPSCHSTNQVAADNAGAKKLEDGTIFITNNQTAGRGQQSNRWYSQPEMNLTFTLVFYPRALALKDQFMLNAAVSLGISDVLRRYLPDVQVKWPNDIYCHDQKMAGILIQNSLRNSTIETTIVGIGLNVNQKTFPVPAATSLSNLTGSTYDLPALLEALALGIEVRYLQLRRGEFSALLQAYTHRLYRFGMDALYKADTVFSGRITRVLPSGELVLDTNEGEKSFRFKEIQFL